MYTLYFLLQAAKDSSEHVAVVLSSICTLEPIKASLIFITGVPVLLMLNHTRRTYARQCWMSRKSTFIFSVLPQILQLIYSLHLLQKSKDNDNTVMLKLSAKSILSNLLLSKVETF